MNTFKLSAEKRKILGRKIKSLRKAGVVPGNIYSKSVKSQAVQINAKELKGVYEKAGETGVIEITLGKEVVPVLVHNLQIHPVTSEVLHVDFRQVNLKEKVTANIPVEVVGESPVQKSGSGTVVLLLNELEVEALPTDLIEKFEIKAEKLTEVDQVVKVSDLDYDKAKIEVKTNADEIVVKVEPPQKEEVIAAPVAETPAEGEAPAVEGEVKEGEAPAEGKEPSADAKSPKGDVPAVADKSQAK